MSRASIDDEFCAPSSGSERGLFATELRQSLEGGRSIGRCAQWLSNDLLIRFAARIARSREAQAGLAQLPPGKGRLENPPHASGNSW